MSEKFWSGALNPKQNKHILRYLHGVTSLEYCRSDVKFQTFNQSFTIRTVFYGRFALTQLRVKCEYLRHDNTLMKMPPTLLADRKAPIKERQVACLFRLKRNVSQKLPYIFSYWFTYV